MKYQFFTVPVHNGEAATEELNKFLASHRIVQVEKQWLADGANSLWAFAVSYQEALSSKPSGKTKNKDSIDYRQVLSEIDFTHYVRLRELRKQLSEEEGIPAYAVFTNAQLAEMVTLSVSTLSDLAKIDGVGQAKQDKYGEPFLKVLTDLFSQEAST